MAEGGGRLLGALAGFGALFTALGMGAYYGTLYAPAHKQYHSTSTVQAEDYRGPTISLPDIAAIPGAVERMVANPPPKSGEDHERRDLAAQEATAVWAFWMLCLSAVSIIITLVGTVLIYQQVKLTRRAVEDSGKATRAVELQNILARDAQRPWITISCAAGKLLIKDGRLTVTYTCALTNIGALAAYSFHFNTSAQVAYQGQVQGMAERAWARCAKARQPSRHVLLPGEEHLTPGDYRTRLDLSASADEIVDRSHFILLVLVAAHYRIEPDGDWHRTERAFTIGLKSENPFDERYFEANIAPGDYSDRAVTHTSVAGITD